ncbi:MAG: hypothetical protein LBK06_07650 [Planctomycetaceae bacterium]|nr:hypothetical protein [Planctomycetaceae bacterium]
MERLGNGFVEVYQPRRGEMCITGGGAKRNRRTIATLSQKSHRDEIINRH